MEGETTAKLERSKARRPRNAVVAAIFLLLGLGLLVYRGPGWEFMRGAVGDVLIVGCMYFASGVVIASWPIVRLASVGSVAVALEFLQLFEVVEPSAPIWIKLALGTTFDPADLVAYGVGLTVAWGVECLLAMGDE